MFWYIVSFLLSFLLAILITPSVARFAKNKKILDNPTSDRKIHKKPTPLLGGVAIFLSFSFSLGVIYYLGLLNDGAIHSSQILGLFIGGVILMVGGYLDDRFDLKPFYSFLFPVLASLVVVGMGVRVDFITNPFLTGTGPFGRSLFYFDNFDFYFLSLSHLFSFLWILGMTYTTKILDGLDGLVSGVGLIGSLILFIVSLFWNDPMSATSILCLLLGGSLLGFLFFNFNPAKIFLGEGGSTFVGFMLGVLAIISGAKIATALLIMGIPILDVVWNICRRLISGKHIYQADRKHIHHRLLDVGFSHRQAVLFLWFFSLVFGVSSIFLQTNSKILTLGILFLVMVVLVLVLVYFDRQKNKIKNI
jgi:UDP-GlcNAc:undecaprenyl-phosphate/decaprenyl-phosphate GlcNAc-1-phosphate transferase